MRLVYFGSGAFGLPTLGRLSDTHDVLGIVTQPDKPAGRTLEHSPTPVAAWAASHVPGLPLLKPRDANEPEAAARIRALPAEAWVVIAFGQKLGPALLTGRFAINLHASLLPRWRGAAPIHHAILGGDTETGNSVITLADRMDAGLVLAQSRRAILPTHTAGELHDLLSTDGPPLVEQVLRAHGVGHTSGAVQDGRLVTRAGKLGRADAWVDFAQSAELCRRRINGLSPWPGVTARLRGAEIKLLRSEVTPSSSEGLTGQHGAPPGTIVDGPAGIVACGEGTLLRLLEVQAAGKKAMSWTDFARGRRIPAGERFEGSRPC